MLNKFNFNRKINVKKKLEKNVTFLGKISQFSRRKLLEIAQFFFPPCPSPCII